MRETALLDSSRHGALCRDDSADNSTAHLANFALLQETYEHHSSATTDTANADLERTRSRQKAPATGSTKVSKHLKHGIIVISQLLGSQ